MKNNTYRVFAFSESSIKRYLECNKTNFIDLTKYPDFDTIIMFFIDSDLALNFLKDGESVYGYAFTFGQYPTFHFPIELAGIIKPEQKEESLFRVGDRVFDWKFGWMIVKEVFKNKITAIGYKTEFTFVFLDEDFKRLSFTEYDFITGGWSQERPKPLPKVGDIGYFWDDEDLEQKNILYGELKNIDLSHKSQRYYAEGLWLKYFSTEKPF